ncbi:hypothetical protein D3C76_112820 [compost metagenome]
MERTYLYKQDGPICVWLTDDPVKIGQLNYEMYDWMAKHEVTLKGHPFMLFISSPNSENLKKDPEAALAFARDFMTRDQSDLMDWARVLLL